MCSILSLAASSLPFLISLIPSSKDTYLDLFLPDQVFSNFHVQICFSAGIQNQAQALLLHSCLTSDWEQVWATLSSSFPLYRWQEREYRMKQGSCNGLCSARIILMHWVLSVLQGSVGLSSCATGPLSQQEESISLSA